MLSAKVSIGEQLKAKRGRQIANGVFDRPFAAKGKKR